MGLDWTLKDKVIDGKEGEYAQYLTQKANHSMAHTKAWEAFLMKSGEDQPCIFPNEISDKYHKTDKYKKLDRDGQALELLREHCTISPMMTLRAPRIGFDEVATEWAKGIYKSWAGATGKRVQQFREEYPTLDAYLDANHGHYVAELAEVKKGLASITGIFVGAECFRGKIVGMTDWVDEDLQNQAYEDMEPDTLVVYGKELIKAAAAKKRSIKLDSEERSEETSEEIKEIRAAGDWCIFWGENGHAMSPWY